MHACILYMSNSSEELLDTSNTSLFSHNKLSILSFLTHEIMLGISQSISFRSIKKVTHFLGYILGYLQAVSGVWETLPTMRLNRLSLNSP